MEPTLRDGQLLLIRYAVRPRPGALAIVTLPPDPDGRPRPLAVKRLVHYEADGSAWVESDNRAETGAVDSWTVGALPAASVLGVVTCRLRVRRRPG